jgi:hypothetical protein
MRGVRRILALPAALLVVVACADLDVENLNDPDRERALATPGDVETLISGAYQAWWYVQNSYYSYGMASSVMADMHSASWGNSMMKDASQEPRIWPADNDPSYSYANVIERPWYRSYRALAAVRDGLIAIAGEDGELGTADDMQIGTGGADTHRAIAFGRFVQGLGHWVLALVFDQAYILDETTDLTQEQLRVPYTDVQAAAIGYFDEMISLVDQEAFDVPSSWMGNAVVDSERLRRLASMYVAQSLAYTPRTAAERDAANWGGANGILSRLDDAIIEDFIIMCDGETWDNHYIYYTQRSGWSTMDLRSAGPADQLGEWDLWEKETPGLRQPFDMDTDDLRFPDYPPVIGDTHACWGQPRSASCGADGLRQKIEYRGPAEAGFRPERGTYHFSGYYSIPDYAYWSNGGYNAVGACTMHTEFEMDMLRAEANIRLNQNLAETLDLINQTRVTYGGLAAVTGTGPVPEDAPGRCTPRMIVPFPMGQDIGTWQCGDLLEAMKYEKRLETWSTTQGMHWFDDRGWGDLVSGTITQFPVPGQELLVLLEDLYTFGGSPGEVGSAPDVVRWEDGGLRPLQLGDVPTDADIRARAEFFQRMNELDAKESPPDVRR